MAITREPVKGDIVFYESPLTGRIMEIEIDHCDECMCYSQPEEQSDGKCFIWRFPNGNMNQQHTIKEG